MIWSRPSSTTTESCTTTYKSAARLWPRKHWKFRFAQGHEFVAPALIEAPVDQFNLRSHYSDKSYVREILTYETFRDSGAPYCATFHLLLQQNGQFFGLYTYLEALDLDYFERHGIDKGGAWYKAFDDMRRRNLPSLPNYYEKKNRRSEDYSDLFDLLDSLDSLAGQARRDYLYDNVDIPEMLNYLAVNCIIHNNDHLAKNYFLYRDTEGTQRWVKHPWDMDLTFGRNFQGEVLNDEIFADDDDVGIPNVSPSHPLFGDSEHRKWDYWFNHLIDAFYEEPELRQMYFRRLRTVMDEYLVAGRYEARIDELVAPIVDEAEADRQAWGWYGQSQTLAQAVDALKNDYLVPRRDHLFVTHRLPGEIPEAQSSNPSAVINEIMYDPAGLPTEGFVELYNPSLTESVDLSGWRLDGVELALPPGTVLLPDAYLVVVDNDVQFRTAYGSGHYVADQYPGDLDIAGERLTLRDRSGRIVDEVTYDSGAPWPTGPAGGGPSLELIDAAQDNDRPANWSASAGSGGTPGAPNSMMGSGTPVPDLWVNEVLPVNATINVDEQGEADPWIEIYNASGDTIDLGGMYLSDNYGVPAGWQIPGGTTLDGGDWLLIWADAETGEGPLHADFALSAAGGAVGLYTDGGTIIDYLNYGPLPVDVSYGKFPDGIVVVREFVVPTPEAANYIEPVDMILNEYNAVSAVNFLDNDGTDTYWGRVEGNGGDWIELVVTQDSLDARGWQLVISNDTGGPGETIQTLTLTSDSIWSDLRSGTIITVSEDLANDVSYDPANGDWWINVQAADGAGGTYITAADFEVSNSNWQLTIQDDLGTDVFGPAGEGVQPTAGVGSDEVCALQENPGPFVHELSNYSDGTSSTFGSPNVYAAGTLVQDLAAIRPCFTNGECDDGLYCTGVETCVAGQCEASGDPCGAGEWCDDNGDVCSLFGSGDGDFDFDGDVDLTDSAEFQICFNQPGIGSCAPGNMIGTDETIGLDDFGLFAAALAAGGPQ
ncbi:MAG: CotH kinase family protein [Planctomycetota bacterium]